MAAAAQNMTREEYTAYYLSESKKNEIKFNGKKVDLNTLEVDGVDSNDYPDFVDSYITYAEYSNGKKLTDDELAINNFDVVGKQLWQLVKEELAGKYKVVYYSEVEQKVLDD